MPSGSGKNSRALQIYDPVLTNTARQYKPSGFVYDEIAPHIPVETLSGQYPIFDERYFFQDIENKIQDRGQTPEVELAWSTDTFLCEDYGLKASITPRERAQATHPVNALRLEQSKVVQLSTLMAVRREKRLAAVLKKVSAGTPGQLNLGGAATTAFATSTAIEADWKAAKVAAYNATGLTPNVAVVPYLKAYDMATNTTLRDIFKYTVAGAAENIIKLGQVDGEELLLPRVFQGTRLIIPKGALSHTGNVKATKNLSEIWGSSVRFLYVDPNAGWGVPSTVYSFWHPPVTVEGDGTSGAVVDRWHENDPVKDYIRETECVDEKVCAPDAAYELTGC